ncbi:hypothetical protein K4L44_04715 [Halosquirtibacter laminarini]|uniref:Uncharacterized protein n=1 Tax=Halosquirtibacter laminarini TaxID=3374600 RepID=A0AC61NNT5_9BACT|nr:hypothetical protein K4L44_04715 [Prolixibacteraceae bacterium]
MNDFVTVTVNDTNILIDLHSIGLLELFFQLSIEIHTTDFIVNEVTENEQKDILTRNISNNNLQVKSFDAKELSDLFYFHSQQKSNVSIPDCSVWSYAKNNNYVLLTGDGNLRRDAQEDGVDVRGILYVFTLLLDERLIDYNTAISKLEALLRTNARLPHKLFNKYISEWKKKF